MAKDPRIDEYIEKAQPFAQPILKKLRTLVHKACPEVVETIKWGMPCFDYKGPFFHFASFKNHCVASFWKAELLKDSKGVLSPRKNHGGEAMGHLGKMTSLDDLPADADLLELLKEAKTLNDQGVKLQKKPAEPKKPLKVPSDFKSLLNSNTLAHRTFDAFSPSQKREYISWIEEAKTDATREKRMNTALEWIAEGKTRNWKYQK
jgi:uncharacterized protein YdeI (YjbR/CyaY-like superfamily)